MYVRYIETLRKMMSALQLARGCHSIVSIEQYMDMIISGANQIKDACQEMKEKAYERRLPHGTNKP